MLIDFDLAGLEGERTYPAGFNHYIDDGVRHIDAKPGSHLEKSHDCYSAAKIMERFELYITSDEDQPDSSIWTSICSRSQAVLLRLKWRLFAQLVVHKEVHKNKISLVIADRCVFEK